MGSGGDAAKGAVGGGLTGASIGSVAGPYGALIGGAIGAVGGGLMGYFGSSGGSQYDQLLRNKLLELEKTYGAPTQAANASYSDFRKNQAALIAQQEAMSRGEGPSAAALLMREAMDRTTAAQSSLAAGGISRGVNGGAALRSAANNTNAMNANIAGATSLARVNEQLGAMQQLGQTTAAGRAADEGVNMFNAAQQNAENAARRQAQLQALGMANGTYRGEKVSEGDKLLAGGASAFPGMLQAYGQTNQQASAPMGQPGSGGSAPYQPYVQSSWNPGGSSDWAVSLPWNPNAQKP